MEKGVFLIKFHWNLLTMVQLVRDDAIKWRHIRVTGTLWGESPVTGEFSSQKPVTRSFDVFFDLRLSKRLRKQSRRRWFETP